MTTARAELKDMDLNKISGGMVFDAKNCTVSATKDSQRYTGTSGEALLAFTAMCFIRYIPGIIDIDASDTFNAMTDEEKIQIGVKAGLLKAV